MDSGVAEWVTGERHLIPTEVVHSLMEFPLFMYAMNVNVCYV